MRSCMNPLEIRYLEYFKEVLLYGRIKFVSATAFLKFITFLTNKMGKLIIRIVDRNQLIK